MHKIAHIINVAEITESNKNSYLHIAQPATIKSMIVAKDMAKGIADVELWAVKHDSESIDIPDDFKRAKPIEKYAFEYIESLRDIVPHKPLPRITDIILSLYYSSSADYFVYTNLDIGLYPDFYIKVSDQISKGYDALCINRKDLAKTHEGVLLDHNKLELAFVTDGEQHPGIDCFVFKREIVPRLNLGSVYIGFPPVGQVLKTQIELNSEKFLWIKEQRYTFHIGSDRSWRKIKGGYAAENLKQADGLYVPQWKTESKSGIIFRIKRKIKSYLQTLLMKL